MTEPANLYEILKSHKGVNGTTLFDHLTHLFEKLQTDHHEKHVFENFEKLSSFVKQNTFVYKHPKSDKEVNQIVENETELTDWYAQSADLLGRLTKKNEKGQKVVANEMGAFPNLMADAQLLETAGISFGEEETYRLAKSLQRLAVRTGAKRLRFWGKILGTQADYYVAEGLVSNQYADVPPTEDSEPIGTGVNRLSYWVANDVLDDWLELPIITPNHIKAARKIKHVFTGDLNASVNSYPVFPGLEKHLLKVQIIRITHSSVVIPKDQRKEFEDEDKKDNEELDFVEESVYPSFDDLQNPESWVHFHQNILKTGRIKHYVPEKLPQEEKDTLLTDLNEKDPVLDKLKGIPEDILEPFKEVPQWKARVYGDPQVYTTPPPEEGATSYAVVALRSLIWPGSVTIANNNRYFSIYIGYGNKAFQAPIDPLQPNDFGKEPGDLDEQPEPNPDKPLPVQPETDTDAPKPEDNGEDPEEQ